MKNRSGLHIWSVSWPLASRGTHPVVSDSASQENYPLRAGAVFVYVRVDLKWHLSLSGWCCYLVLSPHGTWLSEVRYIFHCRGCSDYERYLGWWGVIPHHGAGAWRRWRCTMTRGNIVMESPTQGTTNIRGTRLSSIVSGHISTQWPCVSWKHVLGTWMRSSECLKPSTCYLTWTGELWHSR